MKKINKILDRWQVKLLLIAVPFVLGFWGFMAYYTVPTKTALCPCLSALYSTVRLFGMSFDGGKNDALPMKYKIMLEAARYLAPIFTGSALYKLVKPYLLDGQTKMRALRKNAMAVHGGVDVTATLKKNLPSYTVLTPNGSNERFHARGQIIAFDDDRESLRYLSENGDRLLGGKNGDHTVYVCLHSPKYRLTRSARVQVSCLSVNCARLFWEKYYLTRFTGDGAAQNPQNPAPKRTKVVIVGFGVYAEAILLQSLLVNVFPSDTPGVAYHVFGEAGDFAARYPKIREILSSDDGSATGDTLVFHHPGALLTDTAICEGAERIILACDDEADTLAAFSDLCRLLPTPPRMFLKLKTKTVPEHLFDTTGESAPGDPLYRVSVTVFGTNDELYAEDTVINKKVRGLAEGLNRTYQRHFPDADGWDELGTVKQRANLTAIDHASVKVRQVLGRDCALDDDALRAYRAVYGQMRDDAGWIDRYQALEHERWCRFYRLEGWEYGKVKDTANKRHDCLTAYGNLSAEVRTYDRDAYDALAEREPDAE